ncbi:BNR repeat protein [Prosthecobacter fusiformis]|uniref:BNR repeat protein n=1 Tax=Prosthecobacter fusiformis TaxID=48464 RepID=A0A4V6Q5P9_9BACT|nr:sialidase family protein [Prosthecobacter fusiformis]TDU81723.1 BNR repeat protein [Prosthecobacter fusiformis]
MKTFLSACFFIQLLLSSSIWAQAPKTQQSLVFHREDSFAGWPANEGLWNWGDEILVGFNVAKFEERGHLHSFSGRQRIAFARSLDGGITWALENHDHVVPPAMLGQPESSLVAPGGVDFTHPDFAMKLRGRFFYTSINRGRQWQGPFKIPSFGQSMDARTSYIVTGKSSCLFFIPCTVSDGRGSRIRSCSVETLDGGKTFHFLSWIGPDPLDETIGEVIPNGDDVSSTMPSVIRLENGHLICALRHRIKSRKWSSIQQSSDNGHSWQPLSILEKGATNPVTLLSLDGGKVAAIYGNRRKVPCSISAKISEDAGATWSEEITLREAGRKWDLGYTRAALRDDGRVTVIYYYSTQERPQQHIEATLWQP